MPLKFKIILFLILFFLLLPFRRSEATEVLNNGGITIWADLLTHDNENDIYRADGNVMIFWNGAILIAETATLNESTNEAVAVGNVRLVKGGDVLYCDWITLNLATEKGELINGNLFSRKSNSHIRGERMEKVGADEYHIDRGTLTNCDGDNPSWKFTANDINVSLEDFATGKNALFHIQDIPVFYFPYLLYPVSRERESGFLIPNIGNSSKKGFNFTIPYYWAISPSQEAEFTLDVQTNRGVGFAADYNWMRSTESFGKSHGYYIYDTGEKEVRGNLAVQEQEWFSPSFVLKSDIDLVSDHNFFLDYADESGQYNRQILDSSISLTKNWQNYSLSGETRYVQDLEVESNSNTLQKLPDIDFSAIRQSINGLPLYLGLDSYFVNFYHENGIRGQRLDIHPTAALYLPITDGVHFSAWGGYSERLYNAYSGDPGNGTLTFGLAEAGAKVVASFTKVYETRGDSLRSIRHVVVPEFGYSLIEEKNQGSLPGFDYYDRVCGQSLTSWALTNYLTGKFQKGEAPPVYRDLLYLRLSQGYQLSGTRRDLLTLVDDGNHLTDLRIEANFSPLTNISIITDSRFNTYDTRFSTAMIGFHLNDNQKDGKVNSVDLSYSFARERSIGPFSAQTDLDPTDTTTGDQVNYLEAKVKLGIFKPFIFSNLFRYSSGRVLETSTSLEYRHQCWSVVLNYHDRPVVSDQGFTINFALAGVGPLGKYKAF